MLGLDLRVFGSAEEDLQRAQLMDLVFAAGLDLSVLCLAKEELEGA